MNRDQVAKKPSGLKWFCAALDKFKLIREVTGREPTPLDDFLTPGRMERLLLTKYYAKNTKTAEQDQIMNRIGELGGIVNCNLLAAANKQNSAAHYRENLQELWRCES